jgi:hypothetical protein
MKRTLLEKRESAQGAWYATLFQNTISSYHHKTGEGKQG